MLRTFFSTFHLNLIPELQTWGLVSSRDFRLHLNSVSNLRWKFTRKISNNRRCYSQSHVSRFSLSHANLTLHRNEYSACYTNLIPCVYTQTHTHTHKETEAGPKTCTNHLLQLEHLINPVCGWIYC